MLNAWSDNSHPGNYQPRTTPTHGNKPSDNFSHQKNGIVPVGIIRVQIVQGVLLGMGNVLVLSSQELSG